MFVFTGLRIAIVAAAACAAAGAATLGLAQTADAPAAPLTTVRRSPPAEAARPKPPSLAPVVTRVLPAIVGIRGSAASDTLAASTGAAPAESSYSPLVPAAPAGGSVLGSGFIIDPAGYVVTSDRLVARAGHLAVALTDGRRLRARIVGEDAATDLALLKIEAGGKLPALAWADGDGAQVGDWILAFGDPLGLGAAANAGIVSAAGRNLDLGPYDDFLQIDAAVNAGDAGGPAVGLDGKVIGVDTAILSAAGGSIGIGFAIPARLARPVISELRRHGTVERGWLGVRVQPVTPAIARSLGLPKAAGAIIDDVFASSPAERSGLRQGDVILSVAGHAGAADDLARTVAAARAGLAVPVTIWRDGRIVVRTPVITRMPGTSSRPGGARRTARALAAFGLEVGPLTEQVAHELGVPSSVEGAVILAIAASAPLADSGLTPGDIVEAVGRRRIVSPEQLAERLAAATNPPGSAPGPLDALLFLVNRHGEHLYVGWSREAETNPAAEPEFRPQ